MHSPQKVILDKAGIIRQLGLFADLTSREINFIARASEFYEYKKDEIIYNEGDQPDAFYYIISGRVRIFTKDKYGEPTTLENLHRGSYFGIISLLTGEPHSVSAQVVNDIVVLKILKEDFHKILREIPKLAIHFTSTISRRLKRRDLGQKTVFESTIISVYGMERGIGSTLYGFSLAQALSAETKKDVIFLDMAPVGEKGVSEFLDVKTQLPPLELMSVFFDEVRVKNSILKHKSGINILRIPYGTGLGGFSYRKPNHCPLADEQKAQITPLLSYLTNIFDYCVVDLPADMDGIVRTVLGQSDLVHLLADNNRKNIDSLNSFIKGLESGVREPQRKIKVIINEVRGGLEDRQLLNYRVYATLPDRNKDEHGYLLAVRRIAREIGEVLVGLALGSGAALGLSHIGVIKVLEREGIPIDVVAGSSMGALIAAFWALGNNGEEMERIAIANKKRLGVFRFKDLTFPIRGLIADSKTVYFLRSYLGEKTFHDIKFPLKIVATSLKDRKEVIIDSGPLAEAVRVSISIPGIYSPVRHMDRYLIDGGILNPMPVSVLLKMKVKKIIAVNTLPSPEDIERGLSIEKELLAKEEAELKKKNFFERVFFKFKNRMINYFTPNILDTIVNSMQAMEYSLAEANSRQADVVIHPRVAGWSWRDFLNPEKIIPLGEEACERALPAIKKLIEEE